MFQNYKAIYPRLCAFIGFALAVVEMVVTSNASQTVTLRWDANPEPDIAGYRVYYGNSSGDYTVALDMRKTTEASVSGLEESHTYFFVVTAYNTAGLESLPSNEASFSPLLATNPGKRLYRGLITPDAGSAPCGSFAMTTSSSGIVSGRVVFHGTAYPWRGTFDGNGDLSLFILRAPTPGYLTVLLHLDSATDEISGTITDGTSAATITAGQASLDPNTGESTSRGRYTVAFFPDGASSNEPQGYGFGALTVSSYGAARMTGTLADGTKFMLGASLVNARGLPVYVPLYNRLGSLFGEITFRDSDGLSDADAVLRWSKPERLADKRFKAPFAIDLPLRAARYNFSIYAPLLSGLVESAGVATLSFSGGDPGAAGTPSQPVLLSGVNPAIIFPPNLQRISITLATRSGKWSGSFTDPIGRMRTFGGILFQKGTGCGYGMFLDATQSGRVMIDPGISTDSN